MKIIDVKTVNQLSVGHVGIKPGSVNLIAAGRQCGKSFMIDHMISQLYGHRFTLPKWAMLAAQRRNDQKTWWKRFFG